MDLTSMFDVTMSPFELVLRGSIMYWGLFLVFRFLLRRDMGAIGVADVLFIVLVADASQNAMAGGYTSITEGAVLIGTLVFWNVLLDQVAFRFAWSARFLEPPPLLLIRHGRVLGKNLRRELVTMAELRAHLRANGVETPMEVKAAWLESDGQFSVVKNTPDLTEPAKRGKRPGI